MQRISCFYCEHCKTETHFVPIHRATAIAGVSRSTIRYWIKNEWVHWIELPSGRKVICERSLCHRRPDRPKALAKAAVP